MDYAVLLDFGSTYTKAICVDMNKQTVLLTTKVPSTVHVDAEIALQQCFDAVKERIGARAFENALKLSTSSAAGGLRIAVSGLTESLSIEAGRNAGFGAGGKVVYKASGILTNDDIENIEKANAEILLICGGYEGGNTELVLKNVETAAGSSLNIPIIYAGNSALAKDVRTLLFSGGKECFIAENMIPDIGKLNIESTVEIIRNLFMTRITNMKGIGKVKTFLNGPVIPTPAAVLDAGTLLYQGTEKSEGIGPYMMVDIGGATTDIYSFIQDTVCNGAKQIGSPEPESKRTVEGDMGMRESSLSVLKEVGEENFAQKCGLSCEYIEKAIAERMDCHEYLADGPEEKKIDETIARAAVRISARRHAGVVTRELCDGYKAVQRGKNLQGITTVIGTGGILVNNDKETACSILKNVNKDAEDKTMHLLPECAEPRIDKDYVFFAAGLLSQYDKETALKIMKNSIGIG